MQTRIKRPDFIHHQKTGIISMIREIVFGFEDGMISTLGVLVGIAIGTNDHFVIILSGFVVVMVESISMGIGSYLSTKSVKEVVERKLKEEKIELKEYPEIEKQELTKIYIKNGWPSNLANKMALAASKNKSLFIQEMAYRELHINPEKIEKPIRGGIFMFFSYVIGGTIPLLPYFIFSVPWAILFSVIITIIGLFFLGCATTKFTKRHWLKAGFEMVFLAGIAALVGYIIGVVANYFLIK
ncbi:MAG: VIT1/CCC1 transporter family protein [Candidatus Nealsonbacteria bacterium]